MTRNQNPDEMVEELARLLENDVEATSAGSEELEQLVHLAAGLRERPTAVPTREFRERLRGQLLTEAATMLPAAEAAPEPATIDWRERFAHWRRSVSLAVASALSATTIGGAGVAIAAQSALPGDSLYGVKRGIESVRMAVASGDLETGRLHLAFAGERLEEVTDGVDELPPSRLIDTLEEMDEATALGANELLDAYDRSGDADILRELATFIDDQRAGLHAITDDLPIEVVPFADRSLELVRRLEIQATELFLGCVDCVGSGTTVPRPGEAPARETDSDTTTGDTTTTEDGTQDTTSDGTADEGVVDDTVDDTIDETVDGTLSDTLDETLDETTGDTVGETLEPSLEPSVEPSLDPSLEPSLDPSLPTDELSETVDGVSETLDDSVGDLLYE